MLKRFISFISALSLVFVLLPEYSQALSGYAHSFPITILSSQVPSTLDDFPFVLDYTDPVLRHTSFGGAVTSLSGADITFTDDDQVTIFDYEIEAYNPETGHLVAWVRIPVLRSFEDTVLYLHIGNSSVTSSLQNPPGVWPGCIAVYHLSEESGSHAESAGRTNVANPIGNPDQSAGGRFGGGVQFSTNPSQPNADSLEAGDDSDLDIHHDLTIFAWAYPTDLSADIDQRIVQRRNGYNHAGYGLNVDSNGSLEQRIDDDWWNSPANVVNEHQWNFLTSTFRQPGRDGKLYVNGQLVGVNWHFNEKFKNDNEPLDIGGVAGRSERTFRGNLDEIRICEYIASPDSILTQYRNSLGEGVFYELEIDANTPPSLTIQDLELIFETSGPTVRVDYTLTDAESDDCSFEFSADQVQYATSPTGPWTDAVIYRDTSALTSSSTGTMHDRYFQPLYWDVSSLANGSYYLRLRPHDGSNLADEYTVSAEPIVLDESISNVLRHGKRVWKGIKRYLQY